MREVTIAGCVETISLVAKSRLSHNSIAERSCINHAASRQINDAGCNNFAPFVITCKSLKGVTGLLESLGHRFDGCRTEGRLISQVLADRQRNFVAANVPRKAN
jgi:hypothetical protein